MKLAFKMTWFFEILKIYLEEQSQIIYNVIKHLISPKIQNMMDVKAYLLQWFVNFLIKRLLIQTNEQELILKTSVLWT